MPRYVNVQHAVVEMPRYVTMRDVRERSAHMGWHWFAPSTMRFFLSRVSSSVYQGPGGVYFVSSEKGPNGVRAYTVRRFDWASGDVDTVGAFQGHASRGSAHRAAKAAAAAEGGAAAC